MNKSPKPPEFSWLTRIAVLNAAVALSCMLVFLGQAFSPWTLGLGVIFGVPLLVVAMVLYLVNVFRELHREGDL